MSGPDGAKDLLTILKGPDRQVGSECHWVVEDSLVFIAPYLVLMVHKWSILVLYGPYEASEHQSAVSSGRRHTWPLPNKLIT